MRLIPGTLLLLLLAAPLVAQDPTDPPLQAEAVYHRAYWLQHGQRDFQAALEAYREVVTMSETADPALAARALGARATCLNWLGRHEEAVHDLERAVRLMPNHANLKKQLEEARQRRGDTSVESQARAERVKKLVLELEGTKGDPSANPAWTTLRNADASVLPTMRGLLRDRRTRVWTSAILSCMDQRPGRPLPEVWNILTEALSTLSDQDSAQILEGLSIVMNRRTSYDRISALGADGFAGMLLRFSNDASRERREWITNCFFRLGVHPNTRVPQFWLMPEDQLDPSSETARALGRATMALVGRGQLERASSVLSRMGNSKLGYAIGTEFARSDDPTLALAGAIHLAGRAVHRSSYATWKIVPDEELSTRILEVARQAVEAGDGIAADFGYRILMPPGLAWRGVEQRTLRAEILRCISEYDGTRATDRLALIGYAYNQEDSRWSASELASFWKALHAEDSRVPEERRKHVRLQIAGMIWFDCEAHPERIDAAIALHRSLASDPVQEREFAETWIKAETRQPLTAERADMRMRMFLHLAREGSPEIALDAWERLVSAARGRSGSLWTESARRALDENVRSMAMETSLHSRVRNRVLGHFIQKMSTPSDRDLLLTILETTVDAAGAETAERSRDDWGPVRHRQAIISRLIEWADQESAQDVLALIDRFDSRSSWVRQLYGGDIFVSLIDPVPTDISPRSVTRRIEAIAGTTRIQQQTYGQLLRSVRRSENHRNAVARVLRALPAKRWDVSHVRIGFVAFTQSAINDWLEASFPALATASQQEAIKGIESALVTGAAPLLFEVVQAGDAELSKLALQALEALTRAAEARRRFEQATDADRTAPLKARLERLMRDGSRTQRLGAIAAAAALPPRDAMPLLLDALESDDEDIAAAAAEALRKLR